LAAFEARPPQREVASFCNRGGAHGQPLVQETIPIRRINFTKRTEFQIRPFGSATAFRPPSGAGQADAIVCVWSGKRGSSTVLAANEDLDPFFSVA
jgi:hypothetical protein